MIRTFAGAFGRVPFAARIAGRFLGDPLPLLGQKPFRGQQITYRLPFRWAAMLNEAPLVEKVMLDRGGKFPKSTVVYALLRPLIGEGVFGQPGGDVVKETRRLLARALAAISPDHIAEVTRAITLEYMDRWLAKPGAPAPVGFDLSRLTVDIVSQCTLGVRFDAAQSRRFSELFGLYHQRSKSVLLMLARDDPGTRARIARELGLIAIGEEMRALIRARFIDGLPPEAAALPFPRALREAGFFTADGGARALDEIAVMLLAGHETTASTLSWLTHELATHADLQEQAAAVVRGEVVAEGPFAGQPPRAVIDALTNEALRLYPPIGFFLREATEPVPLDLRTLPEGSFVIVSPRALHRHHDYWPRPDDFAPERWLAAEEAPARTAFMPFGLGARVCPGAQFAGIELAEITRLLLTRTRLALTPGPAPLPLGNLTSRPEPDIVLAVSPRELN